MRFLGSNYATDHHRSLAASTGVFVSFLIGLSIFFGAAARSEETTRTFRLDFNTVPHDSWQFFALNGDTVSLAPNVEHTYSLLEAHADLVSHSLLDGIPWKEASVSSNYRDYPQSLQDFWEMLLTLDEVRLPLHERYIVVSPINSNGFTGLTPNWGTAPGDTLPSPWDTYEFDHPDVKRAYLNFLTAVVEFFQPRYLAINMEANILLAVSPMRWNAFKELNAYVYAKLKEAYPNLVIASSIQYEHMLGLHSWSADLAAQVQDEYPDVLINETRELLKHTDIIALSTFPYMVEGNVVEEDYYEPAYSLAEEQALPIAIDQTGYISQDLALESFGVNLPGSETLQEQFMSFLMLQALAGRFLFLVNFVATDYGNLFGSAPENLAWAYSGMKNEDGTLKSVIDSWDELLALPYVDWAETP